MRYLFEKLFRGGTPSSAGKNVPELRSQQATENEQQDTAIRIETTPSMQENDAAGSEQLPFRDVAYVLKREPGKKRGDDSILIDEETGLMGIADGISGSNDIKHGLPLAAEASLEVVTQLSKVYEEMRKLAQRIPLEQQSQLLQEEQKNMEINYAVGPLGTFAEQLQKLKTEVTARTLQEAIHVLFALTRAIDDIGKNMKTDGQTTLSVGNTIPLQDGRHVAMFALVGDSYIIKEEASGNMRSLIPPQTWKHYLETHPDYGNQDPEKRRKDAKQPTSSVGMKKNPPGIKSRSSLARMSHSVSVGVTILEPGESLIFASDGIDTIGNSKEKGIANALGQTFDGQADDISVVRCTPQSTEALQQAA